MTSPVARFLLLTLAALTSVGSVAAQPAERRFTDALVARRLFVLAELQCRQRLADSTLTIPQQASWTVELIRIMGQHAAHSRVADQAERWRAAHRVAEQFAESHPEHPQLVLVQIQDALNSLAAGELARMEAEVAVLPDQALARARDEIRTATRQLESLDKQLTEQLAQTGSSSRPADALSESELFSLQNNVRFQLARAFRNQALCYPSGSEDRLAALALAIEKLNATLTQLQRGDGLTWRVYLELAACYRLLGNLEQAQRALTTPLAEDAPSSVRLEARAEQARALIAAGHPQQALDELSRTEPASTPSLPELEFARLEATLSLLTAARQRKDEPLADQWQKKALATVDRIEQDFGNYWGHRANLALLAASASGVAAGNVEILERTARRLYQEGQPDAAIASYEQAATQARSTGDTAAAFGLEYTAAAIEQELARHAAAAERLRRLALEQSSSEQAPKTHLLAAWNAAQEVRSSAGATDQYIGLLQEHLDRWPTGETANKARQWLGNLLEGQQKWEAAVDVYRGIAPDAPQFPAAVAALARCWQQWLQRDRQSGQSDPAVLKGATEFFDRLILGTQPQWPERWSEAQRLAAVVTARLRLEFSSEGLLDAQRVLQAALTSSPDAPATWREEAQALLIVALAGQPGREAEAHRMLQQFGSGSTDRLLELINSLSAMSEQASPELRAQIAKIQLAALDQLQLAAGGLEASQRTRTAEVRAEALRAAGPQREALTMLQQLAVDQPDSRTVQLQLAELLLESDDKELLSQAVTQWQKIAQRVRPGTDDWFRARYCVALALFQRNRPASGQAPSDRAVAAQRLRYLKATSQVDQSSWKNPVDELLQRCVEE